MHRQQRQNDKKQRSFFSLLREGEREARRKKKDLPGNKKGLARSRATWRRERESATEADGANCVGLAQQGTWLTNRNPPSPLFQVTHWNERQINKQKHFFSSAKHVFIAGAAASPPHTRTCTEHSAQHSTEPPAQAQRPRKKNGPFFFFAIDRMRATVGCAVGTPHSKSVNTLLRNVLVAS